MPRRLLYLLLIFILALITSELMLQSLSAGYATKGYLILWTVVPATLFFAFGAWLIVKVVVPKTLFRGKYLAFMLLTFVTSYVIMWFNHIVETLGSRWAGVAPRTADTFSPVVFLERFCDSTIMTTVLLGLAAYAAYEEWLRVSAKEQSLAKTLREYIATVRTRLDSGRIMQGLDDIEASLKNENEDPGEAIDRLSGYLRTQLYELPQPPSTEEFQHKESAGKVAEFLIDRKWRVWRHLAFQFLLLIMASEFFFSAPDKLEIKSWNWVAAICWYLFLNLIVLINRIWLYRRYRRHRSPARYLTEATLFIVGPFLIFLSYNILTSERSLGEVFNPWIIVVLATIGAVLSITLFEIGITGIFLMKFRAQGRMRAEELAAETARQEYLFLRKQINPHFLFNVLNNINILSYDSREEALQMLHELRWLIEYQFEEASSSQTTPERERIFLEAYLRLEASRTDNLEFSTDWKIPSSQTPIPSLLFIPVVENAVKHSRGVAGMRKVEVSMTRTDKCLCFRCANNYNPAKEVSNGAGGIGLYNVRRRLQLLYGDEAAITTTHSSNSFDVTLRIPV